MPGTKDELRAEVATLREELAAERAKVEVLREQQGAHHCHGCGCTHVTRTFPYVAPAAPLQWWQQGTVTCGGEAGAAPVTFGGTSVAAGCAGAGLSTYTLLS